MRQKLKRVSAKRDVSGCIGNKTNHADLLVIDHQDSVRLNHLSHFWLFRHVDVAGEERKIQVLGVVDQVRNSLVKLVIANARGVVAEFIQHHRLGQAVVDIEVKRSLKCVTRIEQNNVLFLCPNLLDNGGDAR